MILIASLEDKKLFYFYSWTESTLTKYSTCFELQRFGKEQEIKSTTPTSHMMIQTSTTKEQVRDLGIMMSNTATFTLYIKNMIKKARDKMGWLLRVFQALGRSRMLTLLKSLVIPLLEYCCQLWNPWKAEGIQAIEAIQRTFA